MAKSTSGCMRARTGSPGARHACSTRRATRWPVCSAAAGSAKRRANNDNSGGSMTDRRLEEIADWTPLFILVYFVAQFIIRISLSANLETDEAQFVGQTYLALGYNNSHPPLYN